MALLTSPTPSLLWTEYFYHTEEHAVHYGWNSSPKCIACCSVKLFGCQS